MTIAKLLKQQHILWLLYRGDLYGGSNRVTIAVPNEFHERFRKSPDGDPFSRPLTDALDQVVEYVRQHPGWVAILSLPRHLTGFSMAEDLARAQGWRKLTEVELRTIHKMMELPLGEWADADPTKIAMYLIDRGNEAA